MNNGLVLKHIGGNLNMVRENGYSERDPFIDYETKVGNYTIYAKNRSTDIFAKDYIYYVVMDAPTQIPGEMKLYFYLRKDMTWDIWDEEVSDEMTYVTAEEAKESLARYIVQAPDFSV